jgi:hypothetical protein
LALLVGRRLGESRKRGCIEGVLHLLLDRQCIADVHSNANGQHQRDEAERKRHCNVARLVMNHW